MTPALAQVAGPQGGKGGDGNFGQAGNAGGGPGQNGGPNGMGGVAGGGGVGTNGGTNGGGGGQGGGPGAGQGGGGPAVIQTLPNIDTAGGTTRTGGNGGNGDDTQGNGSGGGGGAGGYGAISTGGGANAGTLQGGAGGRGGRSGVGQAQAVGSGGGGGGGGGLIEASGVSVDNTGTISGGIGGSGNSIGSRFPTVGGGGGAGGFGVTLEGSDDVLTNRGTISGNRGGAGGNGNSGGSGGGGGIGGVGTTFTGSNNTLTNVTTIFGGIGGAGGTGGRGSAGNDNQGAGSGEINGGVGGVGGAGALGGGGASFGGSNDIVTNSGAIVGGTGGAGGAGGTGGQGGNGFNGAAGNGGSGGTGGVGGEGGVGIAVAGQGTTIVNSGRVSGGDGGAAGTGGSGGAGGQGFQGNANGAAGAPGATGAAGAGGVGITGAGLAVINAGAIQGGLSGDGLTRANAITFTGGTNSLELRSGSSFLGRVVDQTGGGTLILGGATTAADTNLDAGTIGPGQQYDGFAALQKTGNSTWTLTGTNIAALPTSVQQGTLIVNGTLPNAPVTVIGGTLAGTGTVGATTVQSGGTLMPGSAANPYGTLIVNGPLGFAPGSFYNVSISPTQNSRTNVVGTTTIQGGTVNVAAGQGTYAIRQYTILNSTAGVVGTFAGVTSSTAFAFLTPTLAYDANNVYLNIAPASAVTTPTGQQVPNYRTAASNQNQFAVASGLTSAGIRNGGRGPVLNALNQLSVPQAQAAFNSLSGEGITGAQNVAFRSTQLFTSSIFDQTTFYGSGTANSVTLTEKLPGLPSFLALAPSERAPIRELADLPASRVEPVVPVANRESVRTWRAWATGFGGIEDISGNGRIGSAAQHNDVYGGSLGVDYQLLPNYLIGVALGGSNGDFRVNARGTSGTTTGGHIALYDLLELGPYYGASSSSFSYFGNQTTRFVNGFGGLGTEQNRGNFDSHEFRSRVEFGRHLTGIPMLAGFGAVTPFVALEIAELRSNGFTETPLKGGPGLFRLNVSGQSAASVPAYAGLRFQKVTPLGNGMVLAPSLQVAYVHEFAPYRNQIGTIASLPGSTFLVDGARPARDAAQVKAGGELTIGPHSAIFANFDGEFSGINQLYAGKGGFKYVW